MYNYRIIYIYWGYIEWANLLIKIFIIFIYSKIQTNNTKKYNQK